MWWMQHSHRMSLMWLANFLKNTQNAQLLVVIVRMRHELLISWWFFFLLLLHPLKACFSENRWRDRLIWCCKKYKWERERKCWTRQKSCILYALKIIMQYSSDSEIALMHDKQQPLLCYQIFAKMLLYHSSYTKETYTRYFEVNLKLSADFHLLNAVTFCLSNFMRLVLVVLVRKHDKFIRRARERLMKKFFSCLLWSHSEYDSHIINSRVVDCVYCLVTEKHS